MTDDTEKRLSSVEAKLDVVVELKDYMRESSKTRAKNHEEIIQRLAVIETKQTHFMDYQKECDTDRNVLDNRIDALENADSRQAGKMSIINVMIAAFVSGAIAIAAAMVGKQP